jgi:hypothetical protein
MVGIYNGILDHHVPANAGSFKRVTLKVRRELRGRHSTPSLFLLLRDDEPGRPGV